MANITPPKYVKTILTSLQSRGYPAYLVGGCVRDMILGVHPQDWDVCTAALPEQVMAVFPKARPTGLKHGTVTVYVHSRGVEVTTFRSEGSYSDHRHPDAVRFVVSLNDDLSRRDFTMNAIAVPADGLVADPFGGIADIRNRVVRCVGVPDQRFEEDALRMFRALRFSARLGFSIESETYAAIGRKAALASALAPERVRDEVEKLLLTPSPETMYDLISLGLMDSYLLKRLPSPDALHKLTQLPRKSLVRWSALCVILLRHGCIRSAEEFLISLRLDSRTVRCCHDAAQLLSSPAPSSPVEWKRLLNAYGVDTVSCAAACGDALLGRKHQRELKAILKSGECFSMKHLAVTGDDLLALGLNGREVGEMLRFLLEYVMEYPENNRRELLLSLAKCTEEN